MSQNSNISKPKIHFTIELRKRPVKVWNFRVDYQRKTNDWQLSWAKDAQCYVVLSYPCFSEHQLTATRLSLRLNSWFIMAKDAEGCKGSPFKRPLRATRVTPRLLWRTKPLAPETEGLLYKMALSSSLKSSRAILCSVSRTKKPTKRL